MNEFGIISIREIIHIIKKMHGYDFSTFAMTSFKSRLERLMIKYNIQSPESLIKKIREEPDFFEDFLYDISVPSTEMFRDPSLWHWLREDFLSVAIPTSQDRYRIWFPQCVSGGELFSLVILLHETGLLDKVQIIASSMSQTAIELIRSGRYDLKKIEISQENYRRSNGSGDLSDYYIIDRYHAFRDTSLIENVEFTRTFIVCEKFPVNVKLILFRNFLIYTHASQQEKILHSMHNALSANGHIILGIKERINGSNANRIFEPFNEAESVYRKKSNSLGHEL